MIKLKNVSSEIKDIIGCSISISGKTTSVSFLSTQELYALYRIFISIYRYSDISNCCLIIVKSIKFTPRGGNDK